MGMLIESASLRALELEQQVFPDPCRLAAVVARVAHQHQPDAVSLAFPAPGIREHAGEHGELRDCADQAEQADELAEGAAGLGVAKALDRVALHVVPDFVSQDGGELRLVLHAQEQPGPDLHHAVGRHAGVEQRVLTRCTRMSGQWSPATRQAID